MYKDIKEKVKRYKGESEQVIHFLNVQTQTTWHISSQAFS